MRCARRAARACTCAGWCADRAEAAHDVAAAALDLESAIYFGGLHTLTRHPEREAQRLAESAALDALAAALDRYRAHLPTDPTP
jgi:hypothetical protein